MAGLLSGQFGGNPAYNWFDQNREALSRGFTGLIGATNLSQGATNVAGNALFGAGMDRERNALAQQKAETEQQRQQAADIIRNQYNRPDISDALINGGLGLSDAWNNVLTGQQGPELTANQRDFQFAQENPGFAEFLNGGQQAQAPTLTTIYDDNGREQKGYMTTQGFQPVGGPKAAGGSGDLSATETKQLFETEEAIQSANSVISALDQALQLNTQSRSGWGAKELAQTGANLPDWVPFIGGNEAVDNNTLMLENIVTEQALNQLKLTFGASPTEGERQILLQIQGSVGQPPEVRKAIFERAKKAAITRLQFNEDRKRAIQQGQYGTIQAPAQTTATPGGNFTSTGVQWSVGP